MIDKIMAFVAKVAVGKKAVAALGWMHDKMDGKRSEISLAILGLVHILKLASIIPAETADTVEKALFAIIPVTLADKASKVAKIVDKVAGK